MILLRKFIVKTNKYIIMGVFSSIEKAVEELHKKGNFNITKTDCNYVIKEEGEICCVFEFDDIKMNEIIEIE